jgi:AraC-like DNA-binding protein
MARQTPKPEQLEREVAVLELRKTGANWRQIAEAVGYSHASAARKAYLRAYDRTLQAPADELRDLELDRIDRLQMTYWKEAIEGNIKAADFVLKCIQERVRISGLAAPTRIQAEVVSYDATSIDADIERTIRDFERAEQIIISAREIEGGSLEVEKTTSAEGTTTA